MPTTQQRETQRLANEYQQAQARTGASVAAQALTEWQRVSPQSLVTSARAWLTTLLGVVQQEREQSRTVAVSYLRLSRALETGHTLPPTDGKTPDAVCLGDLRDDWAEHTGRDRKEAADDDENVPVEDFDWPTPDNDAQDTAARTSLAVTGVARARQKVERASDLQERGRLDDPEFLRELNTAMQHSGSAASGAAGREALRGGRELMRDVSQTDARAIGWARVTDGNPCAFCAMLAARGAVYRSRRVAGIRNLGSQDVDVDRGDLEKYHDHCHCQTVPIYSRDGFMPDQSQKYAREWTRVTRGLTGAEARSAWRKHIAARR